MLSSSIRGTALKQQLVASRPLGRCVTPVVAAAPSRKERTADRHRRLRKKLNGTPERPRLAVHRSNENIYVQVIDDKAGRTLASTSTVQGEVKQTVDGNGANKAAAEAVGKKIAEVCLANNITKVCFDRGGFAYHGRVQALADAARSAGLQF